MKICRMCRSEKDLTAFSLNKNTSDGRCLYCRQCFSQKSKKYRCNNRDKVRLAKRLWMRKYTKAHPEVNRAKEAAYRARKLNATPVWLSAEQIAEIKRFYKDCPKGYEVDHIVPLKGSNVQGLHVPWNLQYLSVKENKQKYNKTTDC